MRVKNGAATRQRRNRVLQRAKGQVGGRSRLFRTARESVLRGEAFAFRGRREKKRQFRRLWITRLNAAARSRGLQYSRFMEGVRRAEIKLDRKQLSELAIHDPAAFDKVFEAAKTALA